MTSPDLSAIVYVLIGIILVLTIFTGQCGGGSCG